MDWRGYIQQDMKGLEAPFLDPVDIVAGPASVARKVGAKAFAGIPLDIIASLVGDRTAEGVKDVPVLSTVAPLAASVATGFGGARLAELAADPRFQQAAWAPLANQRGSIDLTRKSDGNLQAMQSGDTLRSMERVDANDIVELHEVRDQDKYRRLVQSMTSDGWVGDPIVLVDGRDALMGSHRIAAAREAGVDVPYIDISPGTFDGSAESYEIADLFEDLLKADDEDKYRLAKQLYDEFGIGNEEALRLIKLEADKY